MRRVVRLAATVATISIARCDPPRLGNASLDATALVANQHANGRSARYDTPSNTDDTLRALQALVRLGADPAPAIDAACGLQWVSLIERLLVDYSPARDMLGHLLRECAKRHRRTGDAAFELTDQLRDVLVTAVARGADPDADGVVESAVRVGSAPLLELWCSSSGPTRIARLGASGRRRSSSRSSWGTPRASRPCWLAARGRRRAGRARWWSA
jgi:hypothetical protein